ncbi:hypothetical protein CBR_g20033 [Chara braunii]|uniref:F-box domain-containing protein n=1 Tax=Chara braunii TaxID=69332 RepID=A0A388KZM5_CHABU|nr:hypothetical protein CBR_g20033 [Chara braunii]|eukprot:GBG75403.1 hypothetical protein CBR_g20033 [Chara braunii]
MAMATGRRFEACGNLEKVDDLPPPLLPDWSSLQTDVLAVVLSFLPVRERFRAGSVCQKWRRASLDPGCWTEADLMDVQTKISGKVTRAVIVRSRGQLRSLSIRFCSDQLLEFIGAQCPLLEKVKIDEVKEGDLTLLNKLFEPSIDSIQRFVQGCRRIRSLHLFFLIWVERSREEFTEMVRVLISGFPNLVSLYLDVSAVRCTEVQMVVRCEVLKIDIDDIRFIIEHLPNLECLVLKRAQVTDAVLDVIGRGMPNLRSLSLLYCGYLTRGGLRALQAARKDLHVTMKRCMKGEYDAEFVW